jgi:hypothetical protein
MLSRTQINPAGHLLWEESSDTMVLAGIPPVEALEGAASGQRSSRSLALSEDCRAW